jgi:two-component system chemotaxis response regulator CheY
MAKILAVDDSASMRGMVAFTLRSAGYEVSEAENGQLALDTAAASRFDLVLADVNMPVMDGISMVRELRQRADYKGVPILMLTTESNTDKKMEGKAAGRNRLVGEALRSGAVARHGPSRTRLSVTIKESKALMSSISIAQFHKVFFEESLEGAGCDGNGAACAG